MGLVVSCALMALVLVPAAVLVASVSNGGLTSHALVAAAIGGSVCWVASCLALSATFFGSRLHLPVQAVLLGMLFRLGLPLMAIALLTKLGGQFAERGVLTTILGVYLIALIIETVLALRMTAAPMAASASPMKTA